MKKKREILQCLCCSSPFPGLCSIYECHELQLLFPIGKQSGSPFKNWVVESIAAMGRSLEIPTASGNTLFNAAAELGQKSLTNIVEVIAITLSLYCIFLLTTGTCKFQILKTCTKFRWQINVAWLNNELRKAFFFFFLVWSFMFWTPTLSIRNITCLISKISTKGTPQLKCL